MFAAESTMAIAAETTSAFSAEMTPGVAAETMLTMRAEQLKGSAIPCQDADGGVTRADNLPGRLTVPLCQSSGI